MPWWPDDVWEAMRRGEGCFLCATASMPHNEHGDLVHESDHSYIHLKRNQHRAGHCAVVLKRHVPELHELPEPELQGFVADIASIGRTLAQVFEPVKIDTLMYGHLCPHLHCHVLPQYREDDPEANPDINAGELVLPRQQQTARARMLGERLRRLAAAG